MAGEEREKVTLALVEAVRGIRYDEIPQEARETARHCLLDFFGVALAGSREPLVDILVGEVVRSEAVGKAGEAHRTPEGIAQRQGPPVDLRSEDGLL